MPVTTRPLNTLCIKCREYKKGYEKNPYDCPKLMDKTFTTMNRTKQRMFDCTNFFPKHPNK